MAVFISYIDLDPFRVDLPTITGELTPFFGATSGDYLNYDYLDDEWDAFSVSNTYLNGISLDTSGGGSVIDITPFSPLIDYTTYNTQPSTSWTNNFFTNIQPYSRTDNFTSIIPKITGEAWPVGSSIYWDANNLNYTRTFGRGNQTAYRVVRAAALNDTTGMVESPGKMQMGKFTAGVRVDRDGIVYIDGGDLIDWTPSLPSPYNSSSTTEGLFYAPNLGKYCAERNISENDASGSFYCGTVITRRTTGSGFSSDWNVFDSGYDEKAHFDLSTGEIMRRRFRSTSAWSEIQWHQEPANISGDLNQWVLRMPTYSHGYEASKISAPFAIDLRDYSDLFPAERKPNGEFIVWSHANGNRYIPQLCQQWDSSLSSTSSGWEWSPAGFNAPMWDADSGAERHHPTRSSGNRIIWHTSWGERNSGAQNTNPAEKVGFQPELVKYYYTGAYNLDEFQPLRAAFWLKSENISAAPYWATSTWEGSGASNSLYSFDLPTSGLDPSWEIKGLAVRVQYDTSGGNFSTLTTQDIQTTALATGLNGFHGRGLHPHTVLPRTISPAASGYSDITGSLYIGGWYDDTSSSDEITATLNTFSMESDGKISEIDITISATPDFTAAWHLESVRNRMYLERWMTLTDTVSGGGNESDPWWWIIADGTSAWCAHQWFWNSGSWASLTGANKVVWPDSTRVANRTSKYMKVRTRLHMVNGYTGLWGHVEKHWQFDAAPIILSPGTTGAFDFGFLEGNIPA